MTTYGEGRYACCREHAAMGLDAMDGGVTEVRRVVNVDTYHCHCGKLADFFLLEVLHYHGDDAK